jgi:CheY-like chemotaxis protein
VNATSEGPTDVRTVLVVEDDDDIREIFTEVLKSRGYAVLAASSGSEALETLRAQSDATRPDLILLDLMMPDMDGKQFMQHRSRDATIADIPVVVVTAAGAQKQRAAGIHADGWLSKPVDLDRLLAAVAKYCQVHADPDEESAVSLLGPERVAQFLARRRAEIAPLREALALGDFATVRSIAHNLKGVGASFGFPRISELGEDLEESARASDAVQAGAQVDALERFLASERS